MATSTTNAGVGLALLLCTAVATEARSLLHDRATSSDDLRVR